MLSMVLRADDPNLIFLLLMGWNVYKYEYHGCTLYVYIQWEKE